MIFKLIKDYYGSLPLGSEVEFEKCCTSKRCNKLRSVGVHREFKIDNVRYPDFWEEMVLVSSVSSIFISVVVYL